MGQADVNVNLWLKDKTVRRPVQCHFISGKSRDPAGESSPSPETTAVSLQDAQGKNIVKSNTAISS